MYTNKIKNNNTHKTPNTLQNILKRVKTPFISFKLKDRGESTPYDYESWKMGKLETTNFTDLS